MESQVKKDLKSHLLNYSFYALIMADLYLLRTMVLYKAVSSISLQSPIQLVIFYRISSMSNFLLWAWG